MAYTTINKSSSFMNPVLYNSNGTAIGSGGLTVTGFDFQPDWLALKQRDATESWGTYDAVRGVTKGLSFNSNAIADTRTEGVTTFNSSGFICGSDSRINPSGTHSMVAYGWKANGAGSANTDGSVNSTVSVNSTSKFSIVTWTGTGSVLTVGHGLGVAPKFMLIKKRTVVGDWIVYHEPTSAGATKGFELTTGPINTVSGWFNDTVPTSTVFTTGTNGNINDSGETYVAYCFAEVAGYSKFGKYTGNGSTDGPFIYTGFKPSWVLIKDVADTTSNWMLRDSAMSPSNVVSVKLCPDLPNAETDASWVYTDFLSNGFKLRTLEEDNNTNTSEYAYWAFGQTLVGTNNIPATAR